MSKLHQFFAVLQSKKSQICSLMLVFLCLEGAMAFGNRSYAMSWEVDKANSQVLFQTQGALQVNGGFKDYNALINGDLSGDPSRIDLKITIVAESIFTGSTIQERYLKSETFFNVQQYPVIEFKSIKVTRQDLTHGTIYGNLTIRGITKPATFEVTLESPKYDSKTRCASIHVNAESAIDRDKWGMDTYIPGVEKLIKIRANGVLKARCG